MRAGFLVSACPPCRVASSRLVTKPEVAQPARRSRRMTRASLAKAADLEAVMLDQAPPPPRSLPRMRRDRVTGYTGQFVVQERPGQPRTGFRRLSGGHQLRRYVHLAPLRPGHA